MTRSSRRSLCADESPNGILNSTSGRPGHILDDVLHVDVSLGLVVMPPLQKPADRFLILSSAIAEERYM